jgi:hypothetical protein
VVVAVGMVDTVETIEDCWSVTCGTGDVALALVEVGAARHAVPMFLALTHSDVIAESMFNAFIALSRLWAVTLETG